MRGRLAWLLLCSCASVEAGLQEDRAAVASALERRIGATPPAPELAALLADGLTADEAVRIALAHNAGLRAEYEALGIARAELVQAGLWSNPVFDLNAKFFAGGTEIEGGLTQSFLDLFHRPLRRRAAAAELEAAKAAVTRILVRAAFDVRRAFVDVRAAQQMLALYQEAEVAARSSYELMALLHAAGNVIDPQLTAEQAAWAEARLQLAAAEQEYLEAREPLNVLLGLWGTDTQWRIEGVLAEDCIAGLDWERLEARAVAASLELAENRARAAAAAQRARLTSFTGWFDDFELGLVAKREAGDGWGLGPSGAIALPLFDQGQPERAAAAAELRAILASHEQLAVEVRAAARLLRERLVHLEQRGAFLRAVVLPLRTRLVVETLQNYNGMQVGAFEVLRVKQQQLQAAREYQDSLRAAWLARLDLEELLAGSLNRARLRAENSSHEGASMTPPSPQGH